MENPAPCSTSLVVTLCRPRVLRLRFSSDSPASIPGDRLQGRRLPPRLCWQALREGLNVAQPPSHLPSRAETLSMGPSRAPEKSSAEHRAQDPARGGTVLTRPWLRTHTDILAP